MFFYRIYSQLYKENINAFIDNIIEITTDDKLSMWIFDKLVLIIV